MYLSRNVELQWHISHKTNSGADFKWELIVDVIDDFLAYCSVLSNGHRIKFLQHMIFNWTMSRKYLTRKSWLRLFQLSVRYAVESQHQL